MQISVPDYSLLSMSHVWPLIFTDALREYDYLHASASSGNYRLWLGMRASCQRGRDLGAALLDRPFHDVST